MPRRLVALPLTLLTAAAGLDVLHLFTAVPSVATWHLLTAGLLLGIAVASAEWLDRIFAEPAVRTSGRDLGISVALTLFGVSWALRLGQPEWEPTWTAVLAGWAAALTLLATSVAARRRVAQLSSA